MTRTPRSPRNLVLYDQPFPGVITMRGIESPTLWRIFHETYTLCLVEDTLPGTSVWSYRGRSLATQGGGIMLMEPGEFHVTRDIAHGEAGSFWVVMLPPELVTERAGDRPVHLRPADATLNPGTERHDKLAGALRALVPVLETPTTSLTERKSALQLVVDELITYASGSPETPGRAQDSVLAARAFRNAVDGLQVSSEIADKKREIAKAHRVTPSDLDAAFMELYGEKPNVLAYRALLLKGIGAQLLQPGRMNPHQCTAALTSPCNLTSAAAICHEIKALFGVPAGELRWRWRVERVRTLLSVGHRPTCPIVLSFFADASELSRRFSAQRGITPGAYRHQVSRPGAACRC